MLPLPAAPSPAPPPQDPNPRGDTGHPLTWFFLAWLAVLFLSPAWMLPNTDDSPYFTPAIGLMETGHPAVPMDNQPVYIFSIFPTHALVSGLFWKVAEWLHLPLSFHTYRLSQALFVLGFMGLVTIWLRRSFPDDRPGNRDRMAAFLFLLAWSPFATTWFLARPEVLGGICLLGGILAWHRPIRGFRSDWLRLAGSGLLFGLAAICHPNIALLAGLAALLAAGLEWRRQGWRHSMSLLAFSTLPILGLAAHYLVHYPESLEPFLNHGNEKLSDIDGIYREYRGLMTILDDMIGSDTPLSKRLVLAVHYPPFILCLGWTLLLGWRSDRGAKRAGTLSSFRWLLLAGLWGLLLFAYSQRFLDGFLGLLAAFLLAVSHGSRLADSLRRHIPRRIRMLLTGMGVLVILSWPLMHWVKFQLQPGHFSEPRRFLAAVQGLSGRVEHLFLTESNFLPILFEPLRAGWRGERPLLVHWIFPLLGSRPTDGETAWMRAYLLALANRPNTGRLAWHGARSLLLLDPATRQACLLIRRHILFQVLFQFDGIAYQDRDSLLVTGGPITVQENRAGCPPQFRAEPFPPAAALPPSPVPADPASPGPPDGPESGSGQS